MFYEAVRLRVAPSVAVSRYKSCLACLVRFVVAVLEHCVHDPFLCLVDVIRCFFCRGGQAVAIAVLNVYGVEQLHLDYILRDSLSWPLESLWKT